MSADFIQGVDGPIPVVNTHLVCVLGERIGIPMQHKFLTKADALNLAAWLVAVADDHNEFAALLDAVRNT